MRDAFVKALAEFAAIDETIILVTGDLGFGVLNKFAERFPHQYINAGVAEQNMTAIACGLALGGFKAFTYSIGNFPTLRCLEQIRNDVCYHDASVVVVSIGGGFSYGQLGMSHFATEDMAIMRALPGMKVVVPSEIWEVHDLVEQMLQQGGPGYIRIDKSSGATVRGNNEKVELGKARILRQGQDISLIAIGGIAAEAVAAADILADEGISAKVIVLNSLKPIDSDAILDAATTTRGMVTIEEHSVLGGLGGTVAEICMEHGCVPKFFRRIGLRDQYPTVVGDQQYLRKVYGMDAAAIVSTAKAGLTQNR